jgi:D-inositol-3-phosphate glycosyltransferase
MNKRIAMISVHECPLASSEGKERGGINVYVYELSKALSVQGFDIDMFTRIQDTVNPRVVEINEHARVIHIPNGPKEPLNKRQILSHILEFGGAVNSFIDDEHLTYDLVHAHYYLSGLVALALKDRFPSLPFAMTFHTLGLMKQLTVGTESTDPPERIPIERTLVTRADKLLTVSDNTATYLTSLYGADPQHIRIITPGVDPTIFFPGDAVPAKKRLGLDPTKRFILAVGRIDPVKGFDVLLYAMKMLLATKPELSRDLCLMIVGGDIGEPSAAWSKELASLERLRKLLGLETAVHFVPPQPQQALPDYYNAAEVLVMPSHYESFGMVALEALACGTPVIATDVTGISGIIKEFPRGHIVSANNPILLAEQLLHVLTEPHRKNSSGQSLDQFTWKESARKTAAAYEELLSR